MTSTAPAMNWDVSPSGDRFVFVEFERRAQAAAQVEIALNWAQHLELATPMIGTTLAHYRITAALGAGGMGEVWRAHDEKLGREVALKVLPEEFAADPKRLERFEREARAVAALNHPHIVTIHSVEEVGGIHFLTMELVDGQTPREADPGRRF